MLVPCYNLLFSLYAAAKVTASTRFRETACLPASDFLLAEVGRSHVCIVFGGQPRGMQIERASATSQGRPCKHGRTADRV